MRAFFVELLFCGAQLVGFRVYGAGIDKFRLSLWSGF